MSAARQITRNVFLLCSFVCLGTTVPAARSFAQEAQAAPEKGKTVQVVGANKKLQFSVPAAWQAKQPSVRIIEHEFAAPAPEGADKPGRLTMMAAGGSVQANLDRWKGQFQAKGEGPEAKLEKLQVAGQTVNLIDLSGTYLDRRGPFGPATPRADYRMMGAIIEVPGGGHYFLKFYGPKATLDAHDEAFLAMVKGMQLP